MDPSETSYPAFPMPRQCPFSPPEAYAQLRAAEPISRVRLASGQLAWVVTSHELVSQLFADRRLSTRRELDGYPAVTQVPVEIRKLMVPSIVAMDPPRHGELRRPVIPEFTVRRVQAMRPMVQRIADKYIGELAELPERAADLVATVALPIPSLVICELLGVPYADHEYFQERSATTLNLDRTPQEQLAAVIDLKKYLDELVTRFEAAPGDDLLGRMIVKHREAGTYDHEDMVDLARLLLVAGHETTANMISLGTALLLQHPDQLARLRADADRWPRAIEELLRHFSIVDYLTSRVALEDIEVGGVTVAAGEGIILLTVAADHDPAVFDEPGRFDVDRDAKRHIAFGYGIHQCLGQNLARLELDVVYRTLFERLPTLRIADPEGMRFKKDAFVYGMYRLPVAW